MVPPSRASAGRYHLTPVNFHRILSLGGRALSPEQELRQLAGDSLSALPHPSVAFPSLSAADAAALEAKLFDEAGRLQCGSVLYDRVAGGWRCWCGEQLERRLLASYGAVEGISCDFCGMTAWQTPDRTKRRKRSREAPETEEQEPNTDAEDKRFFHCGSCGVDVCPQCCDDVRADERYHMPCLQCASCKKYVRIAGAGRHACGSVGCPPLSPPSGSTAPRAGWRLHACVPSPASHSLDPAVEEAVRKAPLLQVVPHAHSWDIECTLPTRLWAEKLETRLVQLGCSQQTKRRRSWVASRLTSLILERRRNREEVLVHRPRVLYRATFLTPLLKQI
eukprot:gene4389-3191_t